MDPANLAAAMHFADKVETSATSDCERIQLFVTLEVAAQNS